VRPGKNPLACAVVVGVLLAMDTAPEGLDGPCTASAQAPTASAPTADFFVSPKGNDRWSGRLADPGENDGPFATVARAQQAVRALRKTWKEQRPVRVVLRGGTYYLDRPLEFGPEDSGAEKAPVVYAAAAGERVVLSGGRRIAGGRWGEANGRKAWIVDIPDVKEGKWSFRQLFVSGERRPRTRLPKTGEYRIESLPGYTGDFLRSPTKQFVYAPGNIVPAWRNLREVEVVGITRWLDNRLPIESASDATRTVTFDRPSLFALVSSAVSGDGTARPSVYWVENVFEALDTPGQWYLDRPSGQLYYLPRPGEEVTSAEIVAPRLTQVVRVVGRPGAAAHDLRFEGITFSHTEWQAPADYASSLQAGIEVPGAILFDYAERCAVTGGGIERIGNYGVEVNVGCADIEISHNRIADIGAGGVRIGHFFSWETDGSGRLTERGRQRKAAMPKGPRSQRITVADNEIAHCGRFTPEAVGVFVGDNANNKVIHNHIYDLFYSGISVGSVQDFGPNHAQGNIVEYNHIHDIGQGVLSDLAGIYTCSTPGTRIRFNLVHDVSRRDYGGWGIYPDEGSHDILIEKNLVYRCQDGALFAHHNRNITAENNIFTFNRTAQVERGGIGGFELTCRRNLVYYKEGKAVGDYGNRHCGRDVCAFDHNLYWNASGQPVLFGGKTLAQWQAAGQDKGSIIADPLFVDPEKGYFRLRPGSQAAKIGFEPWDLKAAGPRPRPAALRFAGPLAVHPRNPRYFVDGSGKAIYLGGHQVFTEIQDNAWTKPWVLDWPRHLQFMKERNLNYLRNWIIFSTGGGPTSVASPMPYARTGPGTALDGRPKFDLRRFDETYFKRLHDRIRLAQDQGIVVSVMLFEVYGFNANVKDKALWDGNTFNGKNNVNGIDADPNGDSIGLEFFYGNDPKLRQIQRDYVKKVIDSVNDLDNVIFEVANECGATQWQHDMIDFIHEYEAKHKPRRHLVLMSPGGPDVRGKWVSRPKRDVTGSRADAIAVMSAWANYKQDPPANEEGRPAIMDMDHISPSGSDDRILPWKALTRGYHYSMYDHPFENRRDEGPSWELARRNVGAAVSYSRRFSDLAAAGPHGELSSTKYCLAHPGHEYLVLQPAADVPLTVNVQPGRYRYEWFRPETTKVEKTGSFQAGGGAEEFKAPFAGPAVLYLTVAKEGSSDNKGS